MASWFSLQKSSWLWLLQRSADSFIPFLHEFCNLKLINLSFTYKTVFLRILFWMGNSLVTPVSFALAGKEHPVFWLWKVSVVILSGSTKASTGRNSSSINTQRLICRLTNLHDPQIISYRCKWPLAEKRFPIPALNQAGLVRHEVSPYKVWISLSCMNCFQVTMQSSETVNRIRIFT